MTRTFRDRPRPHSTSVVVTLLNAGVITLAEARRYLRLGEDDKTPNRRNETWS